ncbi:MAG TPA: hypothetical protein VIV60_32265 [Polyangiaceae bacterium]
MTPGEAEHLLKWASEDGVNLVPIDEIDEVKLYLAQCQSVGACELLWCARDEHASDPPEGAVHLGFDYGVWTSPTDYYSILFHEVLFGKFEEMRQFACRLNGALLLGDPADAAPIATTRESLLRGGADLESSNGDVCRVVEIFAFSGVRSPSIALNGSGTLLDRDPSDRSNL